MQLPLIAGKENEAPMLVRVIALIGLLVSGYELLTSVLPIVLIPFSPVLIFDLSISEMRALAISTGFVLVSIGVLKMKRWGLPFGILAVAALILISAALWNRYTDFMRQNIEQRNGKRLTDINTIEYDLSTYYKKYRSYPSATAVSTCEPVSDNLNNALGGTFADPTPGQNYMYAVDSITNPQHYVVMAKFEDPNAAPLTSHENVLGCDCTGSATYCFQR